MPFRKEGREVARPVFGTHAQNAKANPRATPEVSAYVHKLQIEFALSGSQEHAYRPALKELIDRLCRGVVAQNDPKADRGKRPDFVLRKKDAPVGCGEAKDIGVDLDKTEVSSQFRGYLTQFGGKAFLTDYLEFRFFAAGKKVSTVRIGELKGGRIALLPEHFARLAAEIENFADAPGITITNPAELARLMAVKARVLRGRVIAACAEDDARGGEKTELAQWREAFATILLPNLKAEEFADMFAQTVVFGFFSARFNDPTVKDFSRQEAGELIPRTNPFLRKFFNRIAGPGIDPRIVREVEDAVDLYRRTDVNDLLAAFSGEAKRDPILYFYEDFLKAYDPQMKKARGVYYTPEAVVSYIVRSCDILLRETFGLADGLADRSMVDTGFGPLHRVQILDPAVGTGTFLNALVSHIAERFEGQGGSWSRYVDEHLLPRLHGFEILMAPYAVCHLKLTLALQRKGYSPTDKRLGIYLTNSLEPDLPDAATLIEQWLTTEANAASRIKKDVPVMLVLGNPPYNVRSRNKGKRILKLLRDYKAGLNEKKLNLDDDYIKFLRFAEDMVTRTGKGIVAMITNNSYLDGITHRRMREHLRETFDEIYVLDLHGNSKRKETAVDGSKDENVFDIQQGVAIVFLVKTGTRSQLATVKHAEFFGKRYAKYALLDAEDVKSTAWTELAASTPNHFFVPKDATLVAEHAMGVRVSDLFQLASSGVKTERDILTIHHTRDGIASVVEDFKDMSVDELRSKYDLGEDSRDWTVAGAKRDIVVHSGGKALYTRILYRPFDSRETFYTGTSRGFIGTPGRNVMQHMMVGENVALHTSRQANVLNWQHLFVSDAVSSINYIASAGVFGSGLVFPLYLYSFDQEGNPVSREPNFDPGVFAEVVRRLGFTPSPEELFDYIYAVLHAPAYRARYAEQLKIDFPRVPFTANRALFAALASIGGELRALHLMTSPALARPSVTFPVGGDCVVEKMRYDAAAARVWINKSQYFGDVPREAWEHWIGGYQPAQKWLKDRKGRALSFDDIEHYEKTIVALSETARLMREVDVQIERNGGWPDALYAGVERELRTAANREVAKRSKGRSPSYEMDCVGDNVSEVDNPRPPI